nr:AsmA-like C-terminal region-containing protein [Kaistia hirudinis]
MIIGGFIIAVLVAALVVPWFIDWNAYRSTFEREAEKILGQPVRVAGIADASLLPMPSLTFTDVRVGDTGGAPMMTVARFQVHAELIPLLMGSLKIVDMAVDRPAVSVDIANDGSIAWLSRSEASRALDPDAVSLQRVEIKNGSIAYLDRRTGRKVDIDNVNATLDARSLLGPWKAEGGAVVGGMQTMFRIATGRLTDAGMLRVKVEADPATVPVTFSAEGDLGLDGDGLAWSGGFSLARAMVDDGSGKAAGRGWRALGKFVLDPSQLSLPELALAAGPEDRPYGLTGSAKIDLGAEARFDAALKSRQLDLDRAIGKGPNQPANVDQAGAVLVAAISDLPVPSIPGRIDFDIPGVILGGSVVQNLRFGAVSAPEGWKIEEFGADLPGRTRLTGDGIVRTAPLPSFTGGVRLASDQPSIFAAWWRGKSDGNRRPLQPFDMSGQLSLSTAALGISNMSAKLGRSNLRGRVDWQRTAAGRRDLSIDVKADRFDYDQIAALTAIFAGRSPSEPGGIADAFAVKLAAGSLVADDTNFDQVSVDGSYANDALSLRKFSVGNVAGVSIRVDNGRIEKLSTTPSGQISATFKAEALGGVADLALRLMPGSALARWLSSASADLGPANVTVTVAGQGVDGATNANLALNGSLGGTKLDVALGWVGRLAAWRDGTLKASVRVENDDSGQVLRQIGYATAPGTPGGPFSLTMEPRQGTGGSLAAGVPLDFKGAFAGLSYQFDGAIGLDESLLPTAHGRIDVAGDDLGPAFALLVGGVPGSEPARPLALTAALDVAGPSAHATFRDARFGAATAAGSVDFAPQAGRWRLAGTIDTDVADLDYPVRLALGLPADTGDAATLWPKTTFGAPVITDFDLALRLNADRLAVADGLTLANAQLGIGVSSGRTELQLTDADIAGGKVNGSLSIQNSGGDATVSAQFALAGAELGELAWARDDRSVADGKLDMSGQVQGAGRSMAGVVSSLSGGGSLKVGAGTARFVGAGAFGSVIRTADSGRDLGEADLKKLFSGYLDAGTLAFERIEGAFTVGAGVLRAPNLDVATKDATISGGATVDFNDGTLNSQWTLTVDAGDDKVSGVVPQVGVIFRGPFDAPQRVVDVSPFLGYLQIRASERENERIQKLEAEIREKEKLERMMRSYRDDAARRTEAAKAEAARKAAEDKAKAEAAAKAEADRKAAETAAKAEADRKAQEAAAQSEAQRKAAAAAEAARKAAAAKAEADRAAAEAQKAADAAKRAADDAAKSSGGFSPDLLQPVNPN